MICSRATCSELTHTSRSCSAVVPDIRLVITLTAAWQVLRISTLGMPPGAATSRCDPRRIGANGNGMACDPHLVLTVERLERGQQLVRSGGEIADASAGRVV